MQTHIASGVHGPPAQLVHEQRVPSANGQTVALAEHIPLGCEAGHIPRPLQSTATICH